MQVSKLILCLISLMYFTRESNTAPVPKNCKLCTDMLVGKWDCTFGRWIGVVIFEKDNRYQMTPTFKNGEEDTIHVIGKFWIEDNVIFISRVRVSHSIGEHIDEGNYRLIIQPNSYPSLECKTDEGIKVTFTKRIIRIGAN